MAKAKFFRDHIGNNLVVWFGEPQDEYEVEETGNEVILIKNKNGQVISFEKLNFIDSDSEITQVNFETITAN